jgi:hypothetical protein
MKTSNKKSGIKHPAFSFIILIPYQPKTYFLRPPPPPFPPLGAGFEGACDG